MLVIAGIWFIFDPERGRAVIVTAAVVIAIGLRFVPELRGYQFTAWIIAAVTAAMIYPGAFQQWGGVRLRDQWIMLLVVQTVMFGMGTQMSLKDFAGVAKAPRGVFVGIVCHFSVMPLVGLALTKIFHFEPEIAAGIILIGSCSSGLASNVMAYIAKSNLVLSVTVTAITTMVAPFMTPLWMKWLAGSLVPVSYVGMMMEIVKIVIVPIGAALLHDYLKHAPERGRSVVNRTAAFGAVWLAFLVCGGWRSAEGARPHRLAERDRYRRIFVERLRHRRRVSLADALVQLAGSVHAGGVDGGHRLFHDGDDGGGAR